MNTKLIPILLTVTVLVAGIFAFAPIDQASTVHTSGTIITAGGTTLDSAEDTTDRVVAGNGDDITITIGTDDDTPFVVYQILTCGDTAANGAGDLELISLTIDGDDILDFGAPLTAASIAVGNNKQACGDALSIFDEPLGTAGTIYASDGGDIVLTLNGAIAGDTLTSVKVVASVSSGADLEVTSALVPP